MAATTLSMLLHTLFAIGLALWLVSLPGLILAITRKSIQRGWIGRFVTLAVFGAGLMLIGAIGLQSMPAVLVGLLVCCAAWICIEARVITRASLRPVTTVLTEMRLRLVSLFPDDHERLVLSMTRDALERSESTAGYPIVGLPTVRDRWAASVLTAAVRDATLNELVEQRELVIAWTLTGPPPVSWLPSRAAIGRTMAEVKLTKYANSIIHLNACGAVAESRAYREHTSVALELAAVCRLAADPHALYTSTAHRRRVPGSRARRPTRPDTR
ncbi:hypothetical protein AB0J72_46825 [Dactylosporangium sp. NPDC049742]|uniref:hypothetical protein n=1 Tax=Dactylosporangium sp. NPDC049742 TaxID=3154737 RepID=UPI00341CA9E9